MAKKLSEVRIEPVDKGGFIVHHSKDNGDGPYKSPTKSIFTDHAKMLDHVATVTKPSSRPQSFKESLERESKKSID